MNVGVVYGITSFVCMLQIIVILNRTKATEYKENIDKSFCSMLYFFIGFCLVDMLWGFFVSKQFIISQVGFTIISYGFHSMAAISAFIWYGYALSYLDSDEKRRLNIYRYILLCLQVLALISNIWSKEGFSVDASGNYFMGSLRVVFYGLQFSYYFILIIFASIKLLGTKDKRKDYATVLLFSAVPLIFGYGQYLFYDVNMYALGFVMSAILIYSFNVTAQRESFLREKNDKLQVHAYIDALTGLHNRRSYEETMKEFGDKAVDENFIYVSMDVNGLKSINDELGHDVGDELIKGAAKCMSTCFGAYGKIFRVGGDEFVAFIFADEKKAKEVCSDFEATVKGWTGSQVKVLAVSYGYVAGWENLNLTVKGMAKLADKRMYENKEMYYSRRGIDRRGRQDAYDAVCQSYTKILKANLTTDQFTIIQMDEIERTDKMGYDGRISVWLNEFAKRGNVHEGDLDKYLKCTQADNLRKYFRSGKSALCIYYRRKFGEEYIRVMLEIIPAKEYTHMDQVVFIYVKKIGDVDSVGL